MDNNNQGPGNGGNNNGRNNKNGQTILIFVFAALFMLFIMSFLTSRISQLSNQEISYSKFLDMVEDDEVESVTFESYQINIVPKSESDSKDNILTTTYYTARITDDDLLDLLEEHEVEINGTIPNTTASVIYNILSFIIPIVIIWIILGFAMRRMGGSGGIMGVGKSNAKVYVEKETGVTFKDVAGQDEAKESLQEAVDFLNNPKKYTAIGAKLPKGALLVGPPGTGKTLLAKAIAGEAGVPFFSMAGSAFVEMFVGVGASRVRGLFKEAQKQAPCIIFIDEIDAIGKSRDGHYGGGNDEREQTLNQLLAEMDGFDSSKGVMILAATNRPEVLDKALLRPGRFDRRIIVEKPDLKGRVETLKVHARDVLMDDTVDFDEIALATSGAVGSDLANMINEAAINAVKSGRKYVSQEDLFEAVELVIAGKEKKDRILGEEEKRIVAYHEVGHALVTALQKDSEPVQKITIVPRTMGALGYVMQVPEEEKYLMTEKELRADIVTFMAGRAAEEIVFDSVTTGASNDIEKATKTARAMVTQYGMSDKFGHMGLESIENRYLDGRAVLNCGEETASQIDEEVKKILKDAYEQAKELLSENREVLDEIADYLYEHETITGKEFMKIFRKLKGIEEPEEDEESKKKEKSRIKMKPVSKNEPIDLLSPDEEPAEEKIAKAQPAEAEISMAQPTEAEVVKEEPTAEKIANEEPDQAEPQEVDPEDIAQIDEKTAIRMANIKAEHIDVTITDDEVKSKLEINHPIKKQADEVVEDISLKIAKEVTKELKEEEAKPKIDTTKEVKEAKEEKISSGGDEEDRLERLLRGE